MTTNIRMPGSARRTLAVAALLLCAGTAAAEDSHAFAFGLTYTHPDEGRAVDYGLGGSVAYALPLAGPLWGEARVFANVLETGLSGDGGFSQTGAGFDLLLAAGPRRSSHWFFLAGGGGVRNDVRPDANDGSSSFLNAGVGWRARPSPDLGMRPRIELRAVSDSFGDGQTDVALAFVLELLPRPTVGTAAPASLGPVVRLERQVAEVPAAADGPPDADGDGVPDADDRCPETIAGARVERDGCVWEDQVITLANFQFDVGSDVVTAVSGMRLDEVARFFLNQADVKVEIVGHTDAQGSEAYNLALSEERAAAVRQYLVGRGIAGDRLTSRGLGESVPVASNDTAEGRAKNRRVELHIRTRQP